MGPRGALNPAGEPNPLDQLGIENLTEWEVFNRCVDAHAILSARNDHYALRDALRALHGWTIGEIAAGRRGACQFCLGVTPCSDCGAGIDPTAGAA